MFRKRKPAIPVRTTSTKMMPRSRPTLQKPDGMQLLVDDFRRKRELKKLVEQTPTEQVKSQQCITCPLRNTCVDYLKNPTSCMMVPGTPRLSKPKRKPTGRIYEAEHICRICGQNDDCGLQDENRRKCAMFTRKGEDCL